ncbi:MAG: protein translocase subunit SecD [Acidobacteriota bacterium]
MQKINLASVIKLGGVIALVGLLVWLGFFPPKMPKAWDYTGIPKEINLGLDLRGGAHVVLEASPIKEGQKVTKENVAETVEVLRNRIDVKLEPLVQGEGNNRVIVEVAGATDPDAVISSIIIPTVLEFKDDKGNIIVTGADLKESKGELDPSGMPQITMAFNKEGAQKFGAFTAANIGKNLGIYIDGKMIENPQIKDAITGGNAVISGGWQPGELDKATSIARRLQSGALPVKLEPIEKRTVGPTLGADSLDKSVKAGIIGLIMIIIFMVGYYRVPGIVADFSLVVYSLLVLGITVLLGATLTLPGIAAFVLSIGMAVDSNIIIYERIKEEIRHGKTLKAAIDAGFSRAFLTIIDSHVTTLVGALVLMYFGTGPIKGFAVTLTIGIFASLFTALTFTQFCLRQTSDIVTDVKYYGV